jgi:hypothetical protein
LPGLASILFPSNNTFRVAAIKDVLTKSSIYWLRWALTNFWPGVFSTALLLISTSWGTGITGERHGDQLIYIYFYSSWFCLLLHFSFILSFLPVCLKFSS